MTLKSAHVSSIKIYYTDCFLWIYFPIEGDSSILSVRDINCFARSTTFSVGQYGYQVTLNSEPVYTGF